MPSAGAVSGAKPALSPPMPRAPAADAVLVATLPSSFSATEYACLYLCSRTIPQWPAENVCVWYRRLPGDGAEVDVEVFAVQEACPHAGISLFSSDIEDFRDEDLGRTGLDGPCIACPAHSYVFDAGTGRCLTNPGTPDARTLGRSVRLVGAANTTGFIQELIASATSCLPHLAMTFLVFPPRTGIRHGPDAIPMGSRSS